MQSDEAFLAALRADTDDGLSRLAYADWLDERDDRRGAFLRFQLALRPLPPDHPCRPEMERRLSLLRKGLDAEWLAAVEPERAYLATAEPANPNCDCLAASYGPKPRKWGKMRFHTEPQDTECDAWKRLLDAIEEAAADGRDRFDPRQAVGRDLWPQVVTLPATISKLQNVRQLMLYRSHLSRIPPQIAGMGGLEEFIPYTSYRLHWYPLEIARCPNLRRSSVSTRALYGNFKYRPPFPALDEERMPARPWAQPASVFPEWDELNKRPCGVCGKEFVDRQEHRAWISINVATDVLPLLANACSAECLGRLPAGDERHVRTPHKGGPDVRQPPPGYGLATPAVRPSAPWR